ncbi:LutC/YkgG family protein [Gellertiella hungarica]|uniref:L-lactate dehydrogenase complex protein LldG n=1 Tax=Gellertiella hungarica TaxID=1572859 RepID=A0A7W6J3X3_9HYPH|nr:LUD domain-containing protein [Gellertiella hungarica]MBB4064272.1 L-lactate dehydrogenase complex protein LldG [Gellertiella hungarica]
MDSRSAILSKIRATRDTGDETARCLAVESRLARPASGIVPSRGQLDREGRIALFLDMIAKAGATHERTPLPRDVPALAAAYLRAHNLPARLRRGTDPRLEALGFEQEPAIEMLAGASDGSDLAAISHADFGIAETGTLMLLSGPDNPVTLTFLPEHHLVVVRADDIGGDMEAAIARLRMLQGKDRMPRTVNFVSGPSRSADIEQTILLGAHGPRALHVMVVG